jgi:hypothetical protein
MILLTGLFMVLSTQNSPLGAFYMEPFTDFEAAESMRESTRHMQALLEPDQQDFGRKNLLADRETAVPMEKLSAMIEEELESPKISGLMDPVLIDELQEGLVNQQFFQRAQFSSTETNESPQTTEESWKMKLEKALENLNPYYLPYSWQTLD